MNLAIVNILKVIKHISACNILCLLDSEATILHKDFEGNADLTQFFSEIKSLDKICTADIEKLDSYKVLKEEYPNISPFIIHDSTYNKITMILIYFENHVSFQSENESIMTLFNTILKMLNNDFTNNKHTAYHEIIETVSSISSVIYSTSFDNPGYDFISKSVEKIFDIPLELIYGNKLLLLRKIYPADFKIFKKFMKKLKKGKKAAVEYRYLTAEKTIGIIKHTGTPIIKDDKIVRVVGIITDVTEERKLFVQLKSAEEQFMLLMKTASGLIFILDKSGYFLQINSNGASRLGYSKNKIIGRHFLEFVSDDSKSELALAFQKILSNNHTVKFETVLVNNMGQKFAYQIEATNLRTDGKISGMIGTGRDVSGLKKDENLFKQLNAKLTEANRIISIERDRAKEKISILEELNDLKNNFISNVSHELRTPMASIVGFAETIATDQELPLKTILEFNNIILNEGKRLAKLVNDILDFSKLESHGEDLNFEQIDLITELREFVKPIKNQAESKNLLFSYEFPESKIIIKADIERLTKAFGNIVSNAFKFTPSGGKISIIAQEFLNEVEVLISDTGVGISQKDFPKLFQKFSKIDNLKENQPGAGFGLSAAKQIVEMHGGIIRVKSELGKGSTFIIKLPKQNK